MRCKNCGKRLPKDATFCPRCGENVQNDEVPRYVSDKVTSDSPQETPSRYTPEKYGIPIEQKKPETKTEQPKPQPPQQTAENPPEAPTIKQNESPDQAPQSTYSYHDKRTIFSDKNKGKQNPRFLLLVLLIIVLSNIIRVASYIQKQAESNNVFENNTSQADSKFPASSIEAVKPSKPEIYTPLAPNPAEFFNCNPERAGEYEAYDSNGKFHTYFFEIDENYPDIYVSFIDLLQDEYDFALTYVEEEDTGSDKVETTNYYYFYKGNEPIGVVNKNDSIIANIIVTVSRDENTNYVKFDFYYGERVELVVPTWKPDIYPTVFKR